MNVLLSKNNNNNNAIRVHVYVRYINSCFDCKREIASEFLSGIFQILRSVCVTFVVYRYDFNFFRFFLSRRYES
jgi:hypothetical protein